MKVTRIETLRCDAGWRMFSFIKVMTDEGIVGWSEYNESFGSHGLSAVIEAPVADSTTEASEDTLHRRNDGWHDGRAITSDRFPFRILHWTS